MQVLYITVIKETLKLNNLSDLFTLVKILCQKTKIISYLFHIVEYDKLFIYFPNCYKILSLEESEKINLNLAILIPFYCIYLFLRKESVWNARFNNCQMMNSLQGIFDVVVIFITAKNMQCERRFYKHMKAYVLEIYVKVNCENGFFKIYF